MSRGVRIHDCDRDQSRYRERQSQYAITSPFPRTETLVFELNTLPGTTTVAGNQVRSQNFQRGGKPAVLGEVKGWIRAMARFAYRSLVLMGLVMMPATADAEPADSPPDGSPGYRFAEDGSIYLTIRGLPTQNRQAEGNSAELRILLTLPTADAKPTNTVAPSLPVAGFYYDHQGIRYTRLTFLSLVEGRDASRDGEGHANPDASVLLIQLTGQNTASEYTDASASLRLAIDNEPLDLELNSGLLRGHWKGEWIILGAIQVPAEGVEPGTDPHCLKFRGHMPPGTSGSMTIKIPTWCVSPPPSPDWLLDLEFNEELRRLHRP